MLNTEYKVLDTKVNDEALSILNNSSPGVDGFRTPIELSGISLGDEMNQRNGRSVLGKSLQIRINAILNDGLDHVNIRVVVFRYKAANDTVPTPGLIYSQPTFATDWVRAFREVYSRNSQAFQIVWDKSITLDKDYKSEIQLDKYIRMHSHIKFRQATNDQNRLWIMYFYDNLTAAGSIAMRLQARLRYIDN